jgi:hypothetical protein
MADTKHIVPGKPDTLIIIVNRKHLFRGCFFHANMYRGVKMAYLKRPFIAPLLLSKSVLNKIGEYLRKSSKDAYRDVEGILIASVLPGINGMKYSIK